MQKSQPVSKQRKMAAHCIFMLSNEAVSHTVHRFASSPLPTRTSRLIARRSLAAPAFAPAPSQLPPPSSFCCSCLAMEEHRRDSRSRSRTTADFWLFCTVSCHCSSSQRCCSLARSCFSSASDAAGARWKAAPPDGARTKRQERLVVYLADAFP
jgi:hypothetical protein